MPLTIYPGNINDRHLAQAVEIVRKGGVIVIPTDTVYALACDIHATPAIERIARMKQVKPGKANFSFICQDLSNISEFTRPFNTEIFRLMKSVLPGPFTFILNANSNVPAIFKSNKKTIGIRVPDNTIARALVRELGHPVMVTSVHDDDELVEYTTDPHAIEERLGDQVDLVIDGGNSELTPSTVIDCTGNEPVVIREGKGTLPTF
ncbi:MAG TPA: L-threonylcarbamoyladenylate synthase [Bacteroidia bacterium]|jgi:tRNA threonylcarbamoyl adenosine modification protein (Sua5/YciO/YrdC/YwlC family)|nr:threonylcarbamoyl-AMP synthase [Bacteroidia bacterium]HRI42144.1 L-threonylcarbamoyladenylate synthase [Bacteroidia bacterium]HRU60758.1 L-threonylcarbamoyladenylate synthase [Bacteroidia bacterium]